MSVEPKDLTLDAYQENAGKTAIFPRVYGEDQVRDICKALVEGIFQEVDDFDEREIDRYLDQFETPFNRLVYPMLGLAGEVGEMLNKFKKVARDANGLMYPDQLLAFADETGDGLWYLSQIASGLEVSLGEIGSANNAKLASRQDRGVLTGEGDTR